MRKKHIFYVSYLLLVLCITILGSYMLSQYRELTYAGEINRNAYIVLIVVSLLFPFIMGILLAAEYVYSAVKKRKSIFPRLARRAPPKREQPQFLGSALCRG